MEPTIQIKISDQCGYLENLKHNIGSFGSNQINMIKDYFPKTGIKTNIIKAFEEIANQLRARSDDQLYKEDTEMRARFQEFIAKRQALLQDPQKGHELDPWMELSSSPNHAKLKEKLQDASYHIQDVLFACELAAEFEARECVKVSLEDLISLKADLAQEYIDLLPKKSR